VALLMFVIGTLLVPIAISGLWARNLVVNTDRYVETVAPLSSDPAIQDAVINRTSDAVTEAVDVPKLVDDAIGPKGKVLAAPLEAAVGSVVTTATGKLVRSKQFSSVWAGANRRAHSQLVKVLTGTKPGPAAAVIVDLQGVSNKVTDNLRSAGITVASTNTKGPNASIELYSQAQLEKIRGSFHLVEMFASALPWVALLLLGLAVVVAPDRRRGLMGLGLALAVGSGLLLLVFAVGRAIFLDAVPVGGSTAAAAAVFDTMVRFVRGGTRTVLAAGVVVAIAAWLFGPSKLPVRIRGVVSRATSSAGDSAAAHGASSGAVGRWLAQNLGVARGGVGVLCAVTLVAWSQPTAAVVLWIGVAALVALVLIEVLARAAGPLELPTLPTLPTLDEVPEVPSVPTQPDASVRAGASSGAASGTAASGGAASGSAASRSSASGSAASGSSASDTADDASSGV